MISPRTFKLGCIIPFAFYAYHHPDPDVRKSNRVDVDLRNDHIEYLRQVLVLGMPKSGKTTLIKSVRQQIGPSWSLQERKGYIASIVAQIVCDINDVLDQVEQKLDPSYDQAIKYFRDKEESPEWKLDTALAKQCQKLMRSDNFTNVLEDDDIWDNLQYFIDRVNTLVHGGIL